MRQNIRNIDAYRDSQKSAQDAGRKLFKKLAAMTDTIPLSSLGPYYLPKLPRYEEFIFSLGVTDSDKPHHLTTMRNIAKEMSIESHQLTLPHDFGGPMVLSNLISKEEVMLGLSDYQNYVMHKISESLPPEKRWNAATMSDDTNPIPLDAETHKLIQKREDWLDYIARLINSDNFMKLDIDAGLATSSGSPLILAEVKHDTATPNCAITKAMGKGLTIPAGLVTYDGTGIYEPVRYHLTGFGLQGSRRDLSEEQALKILADRIHKQPHFVSHFAMKLHTAVNEAV